jgi:hypothetical protein
MGQFLSQRGNASMSASNILTDWGSGGPYCSAITCPRIRDVEHSDRVPASELSRDSSGHYWCNHCTRQLELMDWAASRHWPAARVQGKMRYAVAAGEEAWFQYLALGSADMVEALYETYIAGTREPLPMIDYGNIPRKEES